MIIVLCVGAIVVIDPMSQRGLTENACQFGIPFIFFCMEYCNAALFVYTDPFADTGDRWIFWSLFLLQEAFAMVSRARARAWARA